MAIYPLRLPPQHLNYTPSMLPVALLVRSFIFVLLLPITKTDAHEQKHCIEHDKRLLLELRNQLVFDSSVSTYLVQWSESDDDCCRWEGVGCDGGGRVISLQLLSEGISGGFNESSSLFHLEYLEDVDLSRNFFEGTRIPGEFHKLTRLTSLDLSFCSLTGYFPDIIFHLPALQYLDLSFNPSLEGTLPQFPRNNSFTTIVLTNTNFSGSLPTHSISNLESLSNLDLSGCRFSGTIPLALSNLTRLLYLDLSHNMFSGSISSINFQPLSNLDFLDLSYNSLSGNVPVSIFTTLPSLSILDLSNNQFSGQLGEFTIINFSTRLSDLDLSSNRLESPIPDSFFNLQSLATLKLSNNFFNETFQAEKFLSLPNLASLDLSGNDLSLASIPSSTDDFNARRSSLNRLDLSNNKITGEIPSWIWDIELLHDLNLSCNMLVDLQMPYNVAASLSFLDLHSNELQGEFPSSLLQRASYVDYSNNRLSGSIPTSICNATNILYLDLSNNNLSGTIPPCLFESSKDLKMHDPERSKTTGLRRDETFPNCTLLALDLSDNNLVGELPHSLANCIFLVVLNLFNNRLSGTIPTSLPQLSVLNLGRNNFTGRIPNFIADCPLLYLVLGNNNLTGKVPQSLRNCNELQVMNVGNNHIEGTFPCMLPSSLQVLVLRSNEFQRDITCRRNKSWSNLQIIDIASNNFSGYLNPLNFSTWRGMTMETVAKLNYRALDFTVDDRLNRGYYREEVTLTIKGVEMKLVKIRPDFTSIDFSNNNFHGDIPDSIGVLDGLYLLNLSHNSLTGTIPKSFSNLTLLGALDLSTNQLSGKIPKDIAGLTFLAVMNVSYNKLVGEIPIGTQIQSFSSDCFEGNAGLCGPPLNISCRNTGHVSPPEQGDEETEREEVEWEYVFVAAGYAVGLGSFSWLLLFCRSFRCKYFEKIEDVSDKMFGFCQNWKRKHGGNKVARK